MRHRGSAEATYDLSKLGATRLACAAAWNGRSAPICRPAAPRGRTWSADETERPNRSAADAARLAVDRTRSGEGRWWALERAPPAAALVAEHLAGRRWLRWVPLSSRRARRLRGVLRRVAERRRPRGCGVLGRARRSDFWFVGSGRVGSPAQRSPRALPGCSQRVLTWRTTLSTLSYISSGCAPPIAAAALPG